jgi:hypothetical protein
LLLLLPLILFLAFKKLLKTFRPSTALARYGFQTLKNYKRQVLNYKRQVKCSLKTTNAKFKNYKRQVLNYLYMCVD